MKNDAQRRDDVSIQEVQAEVHVVERVGPLQSEDVRRIVEIVLHQVALERERSAQRDSDVSVRKRVFDYGD